MANDVLLALLRANIAASMAIIAVFALRKPARQMFGARLAYGLWLVVPAATLGALFDLTTLDRPRAPNALSLAGKAWLTQTGHGTVLLSVWLAGVLGALVLAVWGQWRFLAAAKAGRAGPAVAGIIHARMILPADFAEHFTPEERRLVCAHERAHIDRRDARANALAVLVQCLGWFNPFLHLGARAMRLDQELACDATVIVRLPGERRRYAETLLKTRLVQTALPLGCKWIDRGVHPLEARIAALGRPPPTRRRQDLGRVAMAVLGLATLCVARAIQPPQPPWPALVITYPMAVLVDLDVKR